MKKIIESTVTEAGKTGASKAVDLIVDKFVMPKLEKAFNSPQDICILRDMFREYLNKKYENDKYMNTIVFQHESKTVDDLYIPLAIVQNGKRNSEIVINKDMKNIFENPKKLLIIDTAGTGKSTIIKFLSLLCIKEEFGIPFVIELRKIAKNQTMVDYIIKQIQLSNNDIKDVDIKDLLRRGDFIFFFDGYDEILEEDKTYITKEIREFMIYANNNSFVLTSREDDCLSEFSDLIKYSIKPLKKKEAYELIRKYDNYGELSENLIEEIEKNANYNALKEFLGNPLMVSLLYLTFRYKGVLQYKKHIFYRQVYDALYDRHDTIKGVGVKHNKHSKLDSEDFRRVLCAMGFISVKHGKIEFDKDQILELINEALNIFPEIKTDPVDYLYDIRHSVPLFVEEGLNYKWAHKSFAEYFAAVFICKECKEYEEKVLNDIINTENNQRFYNMLDFCYDMDYKTVTEKLIYPVLDRYISYINGLKIEQKTTDLWEIKAFYAFINDAYCVKIDNKPRAKDRDTMEDIVKAVKMLENIGIKRFNYGCIFSKNENIVLLLKRKELYEVIKLLYRKNVDVFKNVRVKYYPNKSFKDLEIGGYNAFDDTINFNGKDMIISSIFHRNFDFPGCVLDVEKCKKKLNDINEEQKRIDSSFFSLL